MGTAAAATTTVKEAVQVGFGSRGWNHMLLLVCPLP